MTTYFGYSTSVADTKAIEAKGVKVYDRLIDVQYLAQNIASALPDVDVVVLNDGLPPTVMEQVRSVLKTNKTALKLVSELPENVS